MKYAIAISVSAMIALLLFSAEKAKAARGPLQAEAWSFKAGRGIILSKPASTALGMKTAEVRSADIIPGQEPVTVQIFQSASESPAGDGKACGSFFLRSEEAKKLAEGQVLALQKKGLPFVGEVASVKPAAASHGGFSEVLASVSDGKRELRVGDFLEARLAGTKAIRPGAIAIPQSAVVESVRGPFVYAANGESFLRTPVKLGAEQDGVVEVVDGLFEGDVVVTAGSPGLWMIELQAVNGGKGCGDAH